MAQKKKKHWKGKKEEEIIENKIFCSQIFRHDEDDKMCYH